MHGPLSTNNHEAVREAALGGLGIALLPEYQVVADVAAERLHRVLPDHTSETLPAYLVYPSRRHLAPRTRVVIDFLIEEVHRIRSRRTDGRSMEVIESAGFDEGTFVPPLRRDGLTSFAV